MTIQDVRDLDIAKTPDLVSNNRTNTTDLVNNVSEDDDGETVHTVPLHMKVKVRKYERNII